MTRRIRYQIDLEFAPWWPPKVGDKLRGFEGLSGPDPLLHVVSVFEHDDEVRIVTAEWRDDPESARPARWIYEVQTITRAIGGLIRQDGATRRGSS